MSRNFKPPAIRLNRRQSDIVEGSQRQPSAVPRQVRNHLQNGARSKRWVSRGQYIVEVEERVQLPSDYPTGDGQPLVIADPRTDTPLQWPLSKEAIKLLKMYLQRDSFLTAVDEYRCPVELAGKVHLQLGKARTYAIYRELEGHQGDDNRAAWNWLRCEAERGFARSSICLGRETEPCHVADSFYLALAGGVSYIKRLRNEIREKSGLGPVDMRQLRRGMGRVDLEVLDYTIWSNLHHRAARD